MRSAPYDAFISYSHEDRLMAEHFHSALQNFARPWYRMRSFRVFRDTANLAAEPVLEGALQMALNQSRFLIVLASRSAAKSSWVDQELRHWLASHPPESVVLLRLNGTIRWSFADDDFDWSVTDALPLALKNHFRREPVFADLGATASPSLRDPAFRHAVAQVAARLRNVPLDEILGEHLRRRRQARLTAGAVAIVVTLLAVASVVAYRRSLSELRAKELQTKVALSRRLAAQSRAALARRDARLALLLALAGVRSVDTIEARGALLEALVATQHMLADLQASDVPLGAIGIAAEKRLLITGDNNGSVAFWDLASRKALARYRGVQVGAVTDIAVSPDGQLAASGSEAPRLALWDLTRLEQIESPNAEGFCVAFTQDGKSLLVGGRSGVVSVWDLQSHRAAPIRANSSDDTIVAIADAGSGRIVTGSVTGVVRILDRVTLRPLATPDPTPATGASLDVAEDGRRLAMAGGHAARLWDLNDNEPYGDPFVSSSGIVTNARFVGGAPVYPMALAVGSDLKLWSRRS